MALTRWSPRNLFRRQRAEPIEALTPLAEMQREMNRLFDTSLRRWGFDFGDGGMFSPAVDVIEDKDNVIVKAELPGLGKNDVSVTLQDNYLILKGEKRHEEERKGRNFYRCESSYGAFSRVVELPSYIDPKKADARFKDGVLEITLPKTEEAKSKVIEIKVN
jgi:HSP20 family protein